MPPDSERFHRIRLVANVANLAEITNRRRQPRLYVPHFQRIANGRRLAIRRSAAHEGDVMFDTFAHSTNQAIVKCLVVEDPQTTREKRLVVAAQSGSREAFGELCQPWAKVVLQKVQRITRNREDAEDALQDSFLRAFVHIKDFDGRSKFSTWLTRIAINSALMILRKRHHSAEFSLNDEESKCAWEVSDQRPNPEILYAQQERKSTLLAAIENLRPRNRKVLELQLEEESLMETAQILDISVSAAKARLFQARTALRNSAGLRAIAPARAESAA